MGETFSWSRSYSCTFVSLCSCVCRVVVIVRVEQSKTKPACKESYCYKYCWHGYDFESLMCIVIIFQAARACTQEVENTRTDSMYTRSVIACFEPMKAVSQTTEVTCRIDFAFPAGQTPSRKSNVVTCPHASSLPCTNCQCRAHVRGWSTGNRLILFTLH